MPEIEGLPLAKRAFWWHHGRPESEIINALIID